MIATTQSAKLKSQNYSLNLKTDLKSRTYEFSVKLIRFVDGEVNTVSGGIIVKQVIRAATSVGANIVEAKSSSSRRDFVNFYTHALKSANETKYWLSLLKDTSSLNGEKIDNMISEISEIANMLGASIITLKNRNRF